MSDERLRETLAGLREQLSDAIFELRKRGQDDIALGLIQPVERKLEGILAADSSPRSPVSVGQSSEAQHVDGDRIKGSCWRCGKPVLVKSGEAWHSKDDVVWHEVCSYQEQIETLTAQLAALNTANAGSDQRTSARPACNSSGRLPDGQAPSGLAPAAVWCPTHGNAPYYLSTKTGLPCCDFCGGPMVQTPAQPQQEGERERDARRYWRLRVLGAALCESKQLCEGSVLRFTNLDEAVDEDIRINPSRGEAELYALLAAQPATARLQDVGQAGKPHEPSTPPKGTR